MKLTKENLQKMGIEQNFCNGDFEDCINPDCKCYEDCKVEYRDILKREGDNW